jgi:hypothetical protein
MNQIHAAAFLSTLSLATIASAQTRSFDFTIQSTSGLTGTIAAGINTTGTLIGNYDATNTPTGTRTKPGVFGSFGATENVAVPVTLSAGLNGNLESTTGGGFRLNVDLDSGLATIEEYEANFLSAGALEVPISVMLEFDSFRTRTPTSTYIGGFPITLPLGAVTVSQFRVIQTGPSLGTVTANDIGGFNVVVVPVVEVELSLDFLGNVFELPAITIPFALTGELRITGNTAVLESLTPFTLDQSVPIDQAIPQQAFDLPTIIPPGNTASVLFDLTLDTISAMVDAEFASRATGVVTPCPADVNADGDVDGEDVLFFFSRWDAGENRADFNRDGGVDSDDIIAFFARWNAGC